MYNTTLKEVDIHLHKKLNSTTKVGNKNEKYKTANLSYRYTSITLIMMSYIIIVVFMLAMIPMDNCHVSAFSNRHNNIAVQSIINSSKYRGVNTHRSSLCNISIKSSSRLQTQLYGMQNDNNDTSSTANANDSSEETTTTAAADDNLEIIRGDKSNEISDDIWVEIEDGAPTKFEIMKNLLGINIFTYILATLIIFFLSMNTIYGVGWLGQSLGWEDVGTFTKVSESLPLDVDVSGDNYLL
ncbi:hypothetical protein ACHAWC_011874 [Mediolabrus comicus]